MKDLWNRIEAWIAANTDGDLALRKGATEKQIKAVEKKIGRRLPDDLRESFAIHDGQDMPSVRWFDGERRIHPLSSILDQWKMDAEEGDEIPDDLTEDERARQIFIHAGRLPLIGVNYWDGDNVYADFIPGPAGSEGQILYRFDIELVVVGNSWRDFLTEYLRRLESGQLVYRKGVSLYPEAKGSIVVSGDEDGDILSAFGVK